MKNNTKYIIAAVILLTLGGFAWANYYRKTPSMEEEMVVPNDHPPRYMDIESYVKYNISEISPVKETMGGTFYTTSIETNDGKGAVSYEDGHNAYVADFTYTVAQDGRPEITSFTIRE